MTAKIEIHRPLRLAGYSELVERYNLEPIPNWHKSFVATKTVHQIGSSRGIVEEIYPSKYWPDDETKRAIQEIVDMPDRQLDLFIRFCLQNNGRLSSRKREGYFDFLSDDEKARMERVVRSAYGIV